MPPRPGRPRRRTVFATQRVSVPFDWSVRVMAAMSGPMLLAVMYGRPDLGSLACIGALAAPSVGPWTYPQRARRLTGLALAMAAAFAVGAWAGPLAGLPVLVVGAWAAAAALAAGLLGAWAEPFAAITGVACILGAGLGPGQELPGALLVGAGGLWVAFVFCLGWLPHRWQPEADAVAGTFRAVGDFFDALGTPSADGARIAARRQLLAAWDAVGTATPASDDPPQRARLYALLQHAQALLDAAVWLGLQRGTAPEGLAQAVRALGLSTTDPALAELVAVPAPPPAAGRRLLQCYQRLGRARADAAAAVPDPLPDAPPVREGFTDRLHGMGPVRAVHARTAARLGIAVAAGAALGSALPLQFGYWVPLTVLIVMRSDPAGTQVRAVQRALGTVLGVGLAGGLLLARPTAQVAAIGMCAAGYLLPSALARSFLLGSAMRTGYALLLIEAPRPQDFTAVLLGERILDSMLGAAAAVLATLLLWPFAATWQLPGAVAAALRATAGVLRGAGAGAAAALLPTLLSVRTLFDEALGERRRDWPSTERMWPVVVCTLRLGAPVRFAAQGADTSATQPLLTPAAAEGLAAELDRLAAAVAVGGRPPPLPWPPGQGPGALADLVEELHQAVARSTRPVSSQAPAPGILAA
jgi:uncharacterized membrane protein YccC